MKYFLLALMMWGALCIAGAPLVQAEEIYHGKYVQKAQEVQTLVDKAAALFQEKGKDYALKLLNASSGPFRKKEFYIFGTDFNGVVVVQPVNVSMRGKNILQAKGTKGKLFVQEMIAIAKDPGSGWLEYYWKRTNEDAGTLKRSYVKRVPGEDMYVGCGYYVK